MGHKDFWMIVLAVVVAQVAMGAVIVLVHKKSGVHAPAGVPGG